MGTTSENIMISSLAGIVNRQTDGELLLSPIRHSRLPHPVFWLKELQAAYPQVQSEFHSEPTFFLNRYGSLLNGYVLYDRAANSHSINVATSIAGVTDAIIVDPETVSYATAAGLPEIADAREMTYDQVFAQYESRFNRSMIFHMSPAQEDTLRDFAIQQRGFVYYSNPTALDPYVASQDHQGRVFGWGLNEFDLFLQASQNNQQWVASEWVWSTSTTSNWRVPLDRQQTHAPANTVTKPGKHYVAFVMSDGDNIAWLTGDSATDARWFGSSSRGSFDMTWDFSPTLGEMNPVAFNYYYRHASRGQVKDNFVSAGGAGITFPSEYPDNAGLVESMWHSMRMADHRVISISDPTYDTSTLYPVLEDPQVLGMMFKTYFDYYKGRRGAVEFHEGKPIVSVRYSLWDGADTARSIADALNGDPHLDALRDPASYSIVNVHPWSRLGPDGTGSFTPMGNLNQLVQWLDSTKVEVVSLEELIVHLRNNFGTPVDAPLDTTPPIVTIASPLDGATLSSRLVTVLGTASDDVRVARVEISLDGVVWKEVVGQTAWESTVTLGEGSNTIRARAVDASANTATVKVIVTVESAPTSQASTAMIVGGVVVAVVAAAITAGVLVLSRRRRDGKGGERGGDKGP